MIGAVRHAKVAIAVSAAVLAAGVLILVMDRSGSDKAQLGKLVGIPSGASVDRVELLRSSEATVARRGSDGWTLTSSDGFKANEGALQDVVRGLASLEKSQKKTAKPTRHGELGVAWPDSSGTARLVRIFAQGSETPIAEVVVGKAAGTPGALYARLLGEEQVWQCAGTFPPTTDAGAWIHGPISDIQADSIASIDAMGASLAKVDGQWAVSPPDAPRADVLKSVLPYLLSGVQADGVRRERPEDLAAPDQVAVTMKLDDSHTVAVHLWKEGDSVWMRIAQLECSGEAHPKLDQFAPLWAGWVFKLPAWKAGHLGQLFAAPEAAAPPAAAQP